MVNKEKKKKNVNSKYKELLFIDNELKIINKCYNKLFNMEYVNNYPDFDVVLDWDTEEIVIPIKAMEDTEMKTDLLNVIESVKKRAKNGGLN
jgi:hypothetical protein